MTAPPTDYDAVAAAVDAADAVGFVHVGDRFDDDLRYLTRFAGPDRDYVFLFVDGSTLLCAPSLFGEQARREFAGDVVSMGARGQPAGKRAVKALGSLLEGEAGSGRLLVPPDIPHDAAVYLERAGYELASTTAVAEARAVKHDAEVERLRAAQAAAVAGMERAEAVLAEATAGDGGAVDDENEGGDGGDEPPVLQWAGAPLTTERLRREVNAAIAAAGATDAGNSVVGAGPSCADLHFTGEDAIRRAETVLLDLSPRGPHGYYGDLTRTFVVDGDGGWERRAYVAVEAARRAALSQVAAGTPANRVHEEAAAELAAHGFEVHSTERGFVHGVGHGVGVSLHEAPSLRSEDPLAAGHVVTIEPGVYDPDRGGVRLEDLVLVTDDGYELLGEYPFSITPRGR